jgi:hypothetical protein
MELEAPGLHETNFNIQCYKDAIDLTVDGSNGRSVLDKLFFKMKPLKLLKNLKINKIKLVPLHHSYITKDK